ncbi:MULTISPECIES: hypothetical protein [unclassified Megasphaera]|uniref:hypothetical protein n=1 Tax=unclassified Megasphaera TaxID=2626256 RepID=UPI0025B9DBB2|nr:hypothetical protein [Megasphaera sp. UBA4233]
MTGPAYDEDPRPETYFPCLTRYGVICFVVISRHSAAMTPSSALHLTPSQAIQDGNRPRSWVL